MLPIERKTNSRVGLWRYLALLAGLSYVFPAYADVVTSLSAQDMITHLAGQIPTIMRMVTAFAYVMGMMFIIMGVIKMKHLGEMRTQMSHEHSIKGPLLYIAVGAMLLYLPSSVNVGMSSFWTDPSPYDYRLNTDEWSQFYNNIYLVIQLIGTIAFIRGLVMLTHLGGHGGQPGTFGKAMVHIIAGVFCINIYNFIHLVFSALGIFVNT